MKELKEKIIKLKTKRDLLLADLEENNLALKKEKKYNIDLQKARWVISEVFQKTQEKFKNRVEPLVTLAIGSVFDQPLEFKLMFERKRNKIECRPVIIEDGEELNPKDDMGGGILPIISFALRIVLWSLQKPRSRPFMALDEPIKGSLGKDGDLLNKACNMYAEISKKLKIQLLIITHYEEILNVADRVYKVVKEGKESKVKLLKGD